MKTLLEEPVSESEVADLPDGVLVRYVSGIWADPDLREVLGKDRHFITERLRSFGRQGYLTPRERQELCKVLFAGSEPLQRRILHVHGRRGESAAGLEHPAV